MDDQWLEDIRTLFHNQKLAVLSTSLSGHPYTTLVGFAATEDLRRIIFATTRATRKFANLTADARVSLLIDNRTNQSEDFRTAMAVTALGRASEIAPDERGTILALYLLKHPHLRDFVSSPSCALCSIAVSRYCMVHRFQNVVEITIES